MLIPGTCTALVIFGGFVNFFLSSTFFFLKTELAKVKLWVHRKQTKIILHGKYCFLLLNGVLSCV